MASVALDAAGHDDPAAEFRRLGANEHANTAIAAVGQHLATHAVLAASYAAFASRTLNAAANRTLNALPPARRTAPPRLLADLDHPLPPAQLPADVNGSDLAGLLQQAHRRLTVEASAARSAGTRRYYDGRAGAADRPTGAVSLCAGLLDSLQAYAALLLDAISQVVIGAQG